MLANPFITTSLCKVSGEYTNTDKLINVAINLPIYEVNNTNKGYVHTVTFSHRFLLFGSKLEFPWDCGTIQTHAKTLPCARSQSIFYENYEHVLYGC